MGRRADHHGGNVATAYCTDCRSADELCDFHRRARHLASTSVAPPSPRVSWESSTLEQLGFVDAPAIYSELAPSNRSYLDPVTGLPEPELPADWKPQRIRLRQLTNSHAHWGAIAGLLALAALAVAAYLIWDRAGQEQAAELQLAAGELSTALSEVEPALSLHDPSGAAAAATSLLALDASARSLFDLASGLPATTENTMRAAAVEASSSALTLRSTLGAAWSYRAQLEPLGRVPILEDTGDPIEMSEGLTGWQVELAPLLVPTAAAPELTEHATAVAEFVAGLEVWKTEYLDRLAAGDSPGARQSLDRLQSQLDRLTSDLSVVLDAMAATATDSLRQAREALTELSP